MHSPVVKYAALLLVGMVLSSKPMSGSSNSSGRLSSIPVDRSPNNCVRLRSKPVAGSSNSHGRPSSKPVCESSNICGPPSSRPVGGSSNSREQPVALPCHCLPCFTRPHRGGALSLAGCRNVGGECGGLVCWARLLRDFYHEVRLFCLSNRCLYDLMKC